MSLVHTARGARRAGPVATTQPGGKRRVSAAAFMIGGWVAPRNAARGGRSGPPESRPQLEELRSGEWVTEPTARGGRGDRTRPATAELGDAH